MLDRTDRWFITRGSAMIAMLVLYAALDWESLRLGTLEAVYWLTTSAGIEISRANSFVLQASSGLAYEFSAACTYLDLALMLSVLAWATNASTLKNLCLMAVLWPSILVLNALRITGAIVAHERGLDWLWAHEIPTVAIHIGALLGAAMLTRRRDADPRAQASQHGFASQTSSRVAEPTLY